MLRSYRDSLSACCHYIEHFGLWHLLIHHKRRTKHQKYNEVHLDKYINEERSKFSFLKELQKIKDTVKRHWNVKYCHDPAKRYWYENCCHSPALLL